DPIIVAGSTGSRGITAQVMRAVARLPQGAVILPGFDFEMPEPVFLSLTDQANASKGVEDHPQYRFAKFLTALELSPKQVPCWHGVDNRKSRNQLISLSLRPAPVTSQWLSEGPKLGDLSERTSGLTLVEAPVPKSESIAIAIALRKAIDLNQTAALITPDRTLGRRVAAALQRWDVVPDDSAGRPLALTAPGRFLRLVANLAGKPADPIDLIAALKHPLAVSGQNDRGPHLRLTRELELYLRKSGCVTVLPEIIASFSKTRSEGETAWCLWLASWLETVASPGSLTFGAHLAHHIDASETLASGGTDGAGELWEQTAGRDVLKLIAQFQAEADYPGPLSFADYLALIERALASENTRDHDEARPDVMIWGTLEARVQGADLVILGGLNEGVWPEEPGPDQWLNRKLRRDLGLLLPERQIGLSAHDYQQAVAAKSVVLSRSRRSADSETVPSRWLSRLTNLIEGLEQQSGSSVLASMRARGDAFLQQAAILDTPARPHAPENRPAPAPPVSVRPKRYSVTEIQRLIRDPYAIYARRILHLERLDVLSPVPDALTKGSVFHAIFEEAFSVDADFSDTASASERLRLIARRHLDQLPWPGVSAHWFGHLDSIADHLVIEEQGRRLSGKPLALERKGQIDLPGTPFSIKGKADRIDRLPDGTLIIYDYKTGKPPSAHQIRHFDRQLPIEALMAQLGGFEDLQAAPVSHIGHIGLGRTPETNVLALEKSDTIDLGIGSIQAELARLLASYDTASKGYPSRRAMEKMRFDGDYDHLARFGEWDETCDPQVVDLP
ncbi:MAG: double-strand break repair protein AddB, partial [Silicimonas sp.]|nr:double-strand break repair protein AddB [Silicimonas sp.]